jgi:hypothetical protein
MLARFMAEVCAPKSDTYRTTLQGCGKTFALVQNYLEKVIFPQPV